MPSTIRAVFFDAGNTLLFPSVDQIIGDLTREGYTATIEDFHAAERLGKKKLDDWLWPQIRSRQISPKVDLVYWRAYLEELVKRIRIPETEQERLMLSVSQRFKDITTWSRVFPETASFLDSLRSQGYLLGVISNSIGTMEEQLHRADLGRHFGFILDSAVVGIEKPHPEIFQVALDRVGVAPENALFVGDTYSTDIGGASLAGLHGVLMDYVGVYNSDTNLECPRITSLPTLVKILEKL